MVRWIYIIQAQYYILTLSTPLGNRAKEFLLLCREIMHMDRVWLRIHILGWHDNPASEGA